MARILSRRWLASPALVSLLVLAVSARAQVASSLEVATLELGRWADTVAALQREPSRAGTTLHLVVRDAAGQLAECERHRFTLDEAARSAFAVGTCDRRTRSTPLTLIDRAALFVIDEAGFARPRTVAIHALEVREVIEHGRAAQPADVELECSLVVRPYVIDLRSGERTRASPERFALVPGGAGARVSASGDGWSVSAGSMVVEYDVVDRQSGEVVLHETARLACERGASAPPAARDIIPLEPRRAYRGATLTRSLTDDHGSCGGLGGPEQWYRVTLDRPTYLTLRLISEFDAALYVRSGAMDGPEILCRDLASTLETASINLEPGAYYVAVDGTGTHGRYRLVSFEEEHDQRALAPVPVAQMGPAAIDGELVPAVSRYLASCGGAEAPEHVYAVRLEERTVLSIQLASRFDAALYLLGADGREIECASAIGVRSELRRSRMSRRLEAGLYYVVVDGESALAGTGRYVLTHRRLEVR